jgi:hypothetical protein
VCRDLPRRSETNRNEQKRNRKIFQKKIAESRRKAQKERRTAIRPSKMYKKIIMQKNMQYFNLCRPDMQLPVAMPYKALKRPTTAFCIAPISEYPKRLKWP